MMLLAVYAIAATYLVLAAGIMAFSPQHYLTRLAWLNLAAAVFALTLAGFTNGIFFNYDVYFTDFWSATEAINKARDGLLSSVDFFSPIGPIYYSIYSFVIWLDNTPTASTVMHAGALAGFLAAALSVVILRRRTSFLGLSIVLISVVTVAVSGRGNGEILNLATMHFLAPYNRWAWAFFIPVAMSLALPHRRNPLGDGALGLTIALLLMLKVTYGAAALGLLAARAVLVPGAWRQVPLVVGSIFFALAALELATGQFTAHLRDLSITASLPESGLRVWQLFRQLGEMTLFSLVGIIAYLATVETLPVKPIRFTEVWTFLRPVFMILLVAICSCAILMQNHYDVEAAVYPLLLLIALEWTGALQKTPVSTARSNFRERLLITASSLFIVFYPIVDIGMHVGQRLQYYLNGPDPQFAGTPYADLRFKPSLLRSQNSLLNTAPEGYAGVLSGLAMLKDAGVEDASAGRIATLSFSNPFPMLLNQPSPAGTPIWLHERRSFSKRVFVDPEVFFQGVDFVLVPPGPSALRTIYQDALDTQFREHSRSRYWVLLVRLNP